MRGRGRKDGAQNQLVIHIEDVLEWKELGLKSCSTLPDLVTLGKLQSSPNLTSLNCEMG